MVKALALYTTGKFEEVQLNEFEDYGKIVNGSIEMVPVKSFYMTGPSKSRSSKKKNLLCYANEEGLLGKYAQNPWSPLLDTLGLCIQWDFGGLYGNLILLSETPGGIRDGKVDDYVIELCQKYTDCEDEDLFLTQLKKEQKEYRSNPNSKKKNNDITPSTPQNDTLNEKRKSTKRKSTPTVDEDDGKKKKKTPK
jgi:hypothetical protein